MALRGMDVDVVNVVAARLELQAQAISGIITVVDDAVAGLAGVWAGDDLHVFTALWQQTHRPRASSLSRSLDAWIAELRRQARDQTAASNTSGWSAPARLAGTTRTDSRSGRDREWVLAMAELSKAAYEGKAVPPPGFSFYKKIPGPNGFSADVFSYYNSDGSVGYVIAYRGSENIFRHFASDWVFNNASDRIGVGSTQYKQAVDEAREFVSANPGADVTFTGHSLGGGMASVASVATGLPAVTFNAAEPGFSDVYYAMNHDQQPSHLQFAEESLGLTQLSPDESQITTFRTADDPLTGLESSIDGHQAALGSGPTLTYSHPQTWLGSAHAIDNVISSLRDDQSEWWK